MSVTITLSDEQAKLLGMVIDDAIDALDMDALDEVATLNDISEMIKGEA